MIRYHLRFMEPVLTQAALAIGSALDLGDARRVDRKSFDVLLHSVEHP